MDRSERAIVVGENGEKAVKTELEKRGYPVEFGPYGEEDLIIDDLLTIEVKTAYPTKAQGGRSKRWQFCLYAHPQRQKPVDEDLLILRCECDPPVHFIIPRFLLPSKLTKIDITSLDPNLYRGKWSAFREQWGLVGVMWRCRSWESLWSPEEDD